MYLDTLQQLGLSKNEAQIYETLLRAGELSASNIAVRAKVHRRNVYDAIQRLLEKGLVFEILQKRESRFQAVEPRKLMELVQEKEALVQNALPGLEKLFSATHHEQAVYVYRGIEGWKNYMRDIIRVGEPFYCIGGKGAWMDKPVMNFFPQFIRDAERNKIEYHHLFDYEVKELTHDIVKHVGKNFKFLPKGYSAPASIYFFGDRVNLISNIHLGGVEEDLTFTVVVNQQVADAFRIWFRFMWDFCPNG